MPIEHYVQDLLKAKRFFNQIVFNRLLPARKAKFASFANLDPKLQQLLKAQGITNLYYHQTLALEDIQKGKNVLVTTDTASGKSLIYNLAFLKTFLHKPESSALYLFPLKALAQDQLAKLKDFLQPLAPGLRPTMAIFDGDTTTKARQKIKNQPPNILISNPDMLHMGILPQHQLWQCFFQCLQFIVIDEVHTYRGVMGSHMAWVFRRLSRICKYYQKDSPQFILSSATIGNPRELAENLTGQPVKVIDQNCAPRAKRHFLVISPIQDGPSKAALTLLHSALLRGLRTIVYTKSRKMAELLTTWTKQQLRSQAHKISAYRAGLLPEQRREIEQKLAQGKLLAVITTSALELGIDIGDLDLCILMGYPGSIMATWQRSGRVGRRDQESAIILLANEDNLDQFFVAHPEKLFTLPPEQAVVNINNPQISSQHLICAAQELPLCPEEGWLQDKEIQSLIQGLLKDGQLIQTASPPGLILARDLNCHRQVNLRGSGRPLAIVDSASGKQIGSIDHFRALHETHPGAVYLHQSTSYLIDDLQLASQTVLGHPKKVKYFTKVQTEKQTEILDCWKENMVGPYKVAVGRIRVTEKVTGFEKRSVFGQRLLATIPLELEPLIFETQGIWLTIPLSIQQQLENRQFHFMGSIHALEHGLIGVLPLLVLADRNDFGGISQPCHPQLQQAGVFIYDGLPGGAGLCKQAFNQSKSLFDLAWEVISSCSCTLGCPGCIHSPKCGAGNRPLDKKGCLLLLSLTQTGLAQQDPKTPLSRPRSAKITGKQAHQSSTGKKPAAVNLQPVHFVVLDLETRRSAQEVGGWHQAHKMGISCVVLYDSRTETFKTYLEEDTPALVDELCKAELVIGFNLLGFDYQVLGAKTTYNLYTLPTLDLLLEVKKKLGYRLPLDHLARHTLGAEKTANGLQALQWWKQGKIQEIITYCTQDVRLTRDLYLFGHNHGYLLFRNKAKQVVRLEVQW